MQKHYLIAKNWKRVFAVNTVCGLTLELTEERLEFILDCIQGINNQEYYNNIDSEQKMKEILKNGLVFK